MNGQFLPILQQKIIDAQAAPLPLLTRRDVWLPVVPGKALAVIGMRRAGKTSFLWQLLAERHALGVPREGLLYFSFEDERLAGLQYREMGSEYLGRLPDVRPAIAESSVYVLPSYREGTPRTVLEAIAMGRAIITTDAPGCRETVIEGENGFLVPVRNADALAQAMCRFIEQPELLASMGKRSREIAEEKYDVHKVNEVMLREMGIG